MLYDMESFPVENIIQNIFAPPVADIAPQPHNQEDINMHDSSSPALSYASLHPPPHDGPFLPPFSAPHLNKGKGKEIPPPP